MDIILIAAITIDGYIARRNDEVISWSKDLKLFKEQTMGCPVIMGSNTEKTLAVELEGREKIVVHRDADPKKILDGVKELHAISQRLQRDGAAHQRPIR